MPHHLIQRIFGVKKTRLVSSFLLFFYQVENKKGNKLFFKLLCLFLFLASLSLILKEIKKLNKDVINLNCNFNLNEIFKLFLKENEKSAPAFIIERDYAPSHSDPSLRISKVFFVKAFLLEKDLFATICT